MFDYIGKLDIDGTSEWYTRRSRFSQFGAAGIRLRRLGPIADAGKQARATSSPTSGA